MDRRSFSKSLIALTAGAAVAATTSVSAASGLASEVSQPLAVANTKRTRVRLHYRRCRGQVLVSMRVTQLGQITDPIPFQMIVSSTPDMRNVVYQNYYYSSPTTSYVTRARVPILKPGQKLYAQLRLIDKPNVGTGVYHFRRHRRTKGKAAQA